jgi:hypothetical protein
MELLDKIRESVRNNHIRWQNHAAERMFERKIYSQDVTMAILQGSIIESYTEDKPFPSYLILCVINNRPLHIVRAYHEQTDMVYIITAYEPDKNTFNDDFKTRRKK